MPASVSPKTPIERFHFLLKQGQDGLSTAFDMPTLMGYDADHERAQGEVGREGVAVSTIDDMMTLFNGIPLDKVTTSMTVNCSASALLAMYLVMAERNGVPWERVGGTIQNDMLKEFIAQKEWISPPAPSLRIVTDMIEFCAKKAPRWHAVSISGYHIREAARPRCRNSRSRSPTESATSRMRCRAGSMSTNSRRAFRSSGISITTFSKRSPSCAPPAGSGRKLMKERLGAKSRALDDAAHVMRKPPAYR